MAEQNPYGYADYEDPNDPWGTKQAGDTGSTSTPTSLWGSQGPIDSPPILDQQTQQQPAQTWSAGAKAGQNVTLLGFDTAKLEDPNAGNPEVGKYNPAVRTFYNGLKQDVGLARGDMGNMLNYIKANGFPNARVVGDDKIDFGDGNGPIDVIRSDGQIVFQNTTGNPVWEQQHGVSGGSSISNMMSTGDASFDQRVAEIMKGQPGWSYDDAKAWAMRYGPGPNAGGSAAGGGTSTQDIDPFAAMGGGVKLANGAWVPKNHPLAQQAGTQVEENPGYKDTTGAGNPKTSGENTTPNGQPNPGAPEADHVPDNSELLRMLLARADQTLDINKNDPIIKSQADAYRNNMERSRRNYLADQAEQGGPYNQGQMATANRVTAENVGRQTGGFEAELMGRELSARRDEIQNALTQMGSLLTEQQRQQLETEKMNLDAALRRQQMDLQNAQFGAQLSQADRHFLDQLAQQDRFNSSDNAYRYAQLGENARQFDDRLGFDTTERQNYWDWTQRGNRG